MPKYIDISKVTIPKGFFNDLNVPKLFEWLESQPTADVVPRSDFNRLQGQVNRLKKYDEERDIKLHARLISETEIKVTREIFNEIEGYIKHLRKYQYCNEPLAYVFHIFDEAKKKYIGEQRKNERKKM